MLDTVKLRSPFLSEHVAAAIEGLLVNHRAVDRATGEVRYDFTAGPLDGSFDHRVSLVVHRKEWISEPGEKQLNPRWGSASLAERKRLKKWIQKPHTYRQDCEPFLEVEGSIHKAMLGHNVEGGPCSFAPACHWFVSYLSTGLGVELPPAALWQVRKVDWAEAYDVGGPEGVAQYIRALALASYSKRKVRRYDSETVMFPGDTTAVKFYAKGPEFWVHDRRRLKRFDESLVFNLQLRANNLLRVEVSVKAPKLDGDEIGATGVAPTVADVTDEYLMALYAREVGRVLREGKREMEAVRTAELVYERLSALYGSRAGAALYATWIGLATRGEEQTKAGMTRRTFYRHRKQIADANISWHATDVAIVDSYSEVPSGFMPVLSDPRRVTGEDPRVVELLAPYRELVG